MNPCPASIVSLQPDGRCCGLQAAQRVVLGICERCLLVQTADEPVPDHDLAVDQDGFHVGRVRGVHKVVHDLVDGTQVSPVEIDQDEVGPFSGFDDPISEAMPSALAPPIVAISSAW